MIRVLVLILLASQAFGATYYVSSSGSDANNGTSPSTPFKTFHNFRLYGYGWHTPHWGAGDSVLLKRGDTLSGPWYFSNMPGTEANPIYIGAYGTGANPLVLGDVSRAAWAARPGRSGYYQAFVGYGLISFSYEWYAGTWSQVTRKGDIPDGGKEAWLDTLDAGEMGPNPIQDTLYYRPKDGNAPDTLHFAREANIIQYSANVIVRDVDFYGFHNAIYALYDTNLVVRRLKITNNNFIAVRTANCVNSLVDSCRADSVGYTAYYSSLSDRTVFRADTAYWVQDTIRGRYVNGSEQSAFGSQGGEGDELGVGGFGDGRETIIEYCVADNINDAFLDSYYCTDDTIRYNTGTTTLGIFGHGQGTLVTGNVLTVSGRGMQNSSFIGVNAFTYNAIYGVTGEGGMSSYQNDSGGTVIWDHNVIQGASPTAWLMYARDTIGNTITNNSYCGQGVFVKNPWPSEVSYSTLAEWQAATGYDAGSAKTTECPEPESPPAPATHRKRMFTKGKH